MSLARLSRAGLPVPAGFYVTTEVYRYFVSINGLQPRILEAIKGTNISQPASLEAASQRIGDLFAAAQIPEEISKDVSQAYAYLKEVPVAVRSSATAEDLPGMSFAGQQETFLNINGDVKVLEAVKHCWASLWTARAIGYRIKNGIAQDHVSLAVVVQELVPADAAGVMFTANPMNGIRNELVINAAWGLGEAIVSGAVTPDIMVVDKSSGQMLQRITVSKQVMTIRLDAGTYEQHVPDAMVNIPVLSDAQVFELAHLGTHIENLYAMPMDIEWALSGGKFSILQARPITALPEEQVESPVEWKLPDPKGIYMRASIIEQLPEPLSPLFATLGGPIIDECTRRLFVKMAGGKGLKAGLRLFEIINGYGYMNVNFGLWNTLRMSVGQMFKLKSIFKASELRWRQAHDHYSAVIQHWQAKPLGDYTSIELLTGVRSLFTETMEMYTVLQIGPIATALGSETMFTQVYNRLIKKISDPEASVFLMGFTSMPIQAEFSLYDLTEWAHTCPRLADYVSSTPAVQLEADIERSDTPTGLAPEEWHDWKRRFKEQLAKYGHFTYDLDFSKAVAAEDPTPLLEICRMYLIGKAGSPYNRVKKLTEQRDGAFQTMMARLHGPKRWIFQRQVQSAQKFAPLREDGLSDLGLGYPLLRKMLHELGLRLVRSGALEQPNEVFWLSEQELDQAARELDHGHALSSLKEVIKVRRVVWKDEQRLSPPVVLPVGSKYMGMNVEKLTSGGLTDDLHVIKGFAASQGKVTATARVLLGPQDFDQMHMGDVLVAPLTTPAWTPLFAMASAIVTDVGGPLSHSSIVAREYGIPAVLGTGVATRHIHNGQIISVDGTAGTVTCLS